MLRISRAMVYQLVWRGELTPVHIGRAVRFTRHELEQFVASLVEQD